MDKFQTTGAVVAIIILFFQLFEWIPTVHRFILNSIRLPKRGWKMFRKWWAGREERRQWKQFSPEPYLVEKGKLRVEKVSSCNYQMILSIVMSFKNRDERHRMSIECTCVKVGFDSLKLSDRPRERYQLEAGIGLVNLTPGEKRERVEFELAEGGLEAEPILGDKVYCRWVNIGTAHLWGNINPKPLKLLEPFWVEVDKSKIKPPISDK
jgi:hypothetical protein